MKAYAVNYMYNGLIYHTTVDARDKDSVRNKIGRKHGLNAAESKKRITILSAAVIGYY